MPQCAKLDSSLLHYCDFCGTSLKNPRWRIRNGSRAPSSQQYVLRFGRVNSLSDTLDAEVFRDIVGIPGRMCQSDWRAGWYIGQYLGDGILCTSDIENLWRQFTTRSSCSTQYSWKVKVLGAKLVGKTRNWNTDRHSYWLVCGEMAAEKRERLALEILRILPRIQALAAPNEILIVKRPIKLFRRQLIAGKKEHIR